MAASLPVSRLSRQADRLILATLLASVAMALGLGAYYGQTGLALVVGVPLALLGTMAALGSPGSLGTRLVLAAALMASVALHIQLARGLIEMHFGVFVTLAFLLAYRDWRPLVMAAGVIAVHHVLFDRLQAAGLGTYCLTEPDLLRVFVHAGYVVAQTALEIYLATLMRRAATQGDELTALVDHLGSDGVIALDVADLPARTHGAAGLQKALLSLGRVLQTVGGS
ncbi:MAG: chemotaxis protein, partial [Burkholderiales bacterium]|nr:chemotaxis protein [Burkholderiales bacterium]